MKGYPWKQPRVASALDWQSKQTQGDEKQTAPGRRGGSWHSRRDWGREALCAPLWKTIYNSGQEGKLNPAHSVPEGGSPHPLVCFLINRKRELVNWVQVLPNLKLCVQDKVGGHIHAI